MPKIIVNGKEIEFQSGMTVLQACELAGAEIPRFCYHEKLSIAGNCRMCLVEMDKSSKPIASCAMPSAEGLKIKTNTIIIFILLELFGSVMAAYIIEYGLGYKPCKLCIYQRIPYIISIIIILNFLFIKKYRKASLLVLSFISLFGSVLAFYHFGIDQVLFTESAVCDAYPLTTDSLDK